MTPVVLAALWGFGVALYLAMWAFVPFDHQSPVQTLSSEEQRRRRRRTLAMVVIAAALAAVVILAAFIGKSKLGGGAMALWLVILVALAVVSLRSSSPRPTLGRLVAYGFLTLATIVIVVVGGLVAYLGTTNVPFAGGNGERQWQPTSLREIASPYRTQFGSGILDLRHVAFTHTPTTITASVTVGMLEIVVPSNVVVDLHTHVGLGTIQLTTEYGTFSAPPSATTRSGTQPHLILNAAVGIGSLVLERAGAISQSISRPAVPSTPPIAK